MPLKVYDEKGRHVGSIQTHEEMVDERKKKSDAERDAVIGLIVGAVAVVATFIALIVGFLAAPALVLYVFGLELSSPASVFSLAAWWFFLLWMAGRRRLARERKDKQ